MTEAEWLACNDPHLLFRNLSGRVSARKIRLALCGCLRSSKVWPLLTATASRRAVEVSEAFTEGAANLQQLGQARKNANSAAGREWRKKRYNPPAAYLANYVCWQDGGLLSFLHLPIGYLQQLLPPAELIRDVIGNPFRTPADLSTWLSPCVLSLARAAGTERVPASGNLDNARLAVLSDALEEAGCSNAELLTHLRSPGPHVLGCWALDLILGEQ
jgi:hypothetical protein